MTLEPELPRGWPVAAILAGGQGLRMGSDKGLLEVGGEPLFLRLVRGLSSVFSELIISLRADQLSPYQAIVSDSSLNSTLKTSQLCLEWLVDQDDGRGPLEGLRQIFKFLKSNGQAQPVFVIPVDSPYLEFDIVSKLWLESKNRRGALPLVRNRVEPLHAFYSAELLEQTEEALRRGEDTSVRQIASWPGVQTVEIPEAELSDWSFLNLNAEEDLRRFKAGIQNQNWPSSVWNSTEK